MPEAFATATFSHQTSAPAAPPPLPALDVELLGETLGFGGMGEVLRAWDPHLGRAVAVKVLQQRLSSDALPRFLEEARLTARLEHPGIVPVHGLGTLPDGRAAYMMKEIRGQTLAELTRSLQATPLRRRLEWLRRAAEAVGFAHARGVLHRDLKPSNIMVGEHGEVMVLDWGIATLLRRAEPHAEAGLIGTPAYMAPEHARGADLDARADVFALGAILLELLGGGPLWGDRPTDGILSALRAGAIPAPDARLSGAPEDLAALCRASLQATPALRPPDAAAFAVALGRWLEGEAQRERALLLVEEAGRDLAEHDEARAEEEVLRLRAARLAITLPRHLPVETRRPLWALEDEADALAAQADEAEQRALLRLDAAFQLSPGLPEAHDRLATHHRARAEAAEVRGDATAALPHLRAVSRHHRGRMQRWLDGVGALTLVTEPPGAEVQMRPYILRDRRLVPGEPVSLGPTPLRELPVPAGSALLEIHAPGRRVVPYPVLIQRDACWDGVRPGGEVPHPIYLPGPEDLGPDEIYAPAGWFRTGDPGGFKALPRRRVWLDGRIARRHHVTVAEYMRFLEDLAARQGLDAALALLPRERLERAGTDRGRGGVTLDPDGRARLVPDADGDTWDPQHPVILVGLREARAYAAWLARREGRPWRLPGEVEIEKLHRGVDGRAWPWGDRFDPSFCWMEDSFGPRRVLPTVGTRPEATSPYGIEDAVGLARYWCMERFEPLGTVAAQGEVQPEPTDSNPSDQDYYAMRGGSWVMSATSARVGMRFKNRATYRAYDIGVRVVRTWDPALRTG